MKRIFDNKLFIFILGAVLSSGVTYAATLLANNVSYDNTNSGINSTNVQGAIDELYTKANNPTIPANYKELSTVTTATANDILFGKTAYNNNGELISGELPDGIRFKLCAHTWAANTYGGTNIDFTDFGYNNINVEKVFYSNGGIIDYYFADSSYNTISLNLDQDYSISDNQIKYLYVRGSINSSYGYYCATVHLFN